MDGRYSALRTLVKELSAYTVSGAFTSFLDREINIGQGTRGRASTSHNHLRDFLVAENGRDSAFPRILQLVDDDFLGGSFARKSKIWPLDDIDIYFPIDGVGLVYTQQGSTPPYRPRTDRVLNENPLVSVPDRWMEGINISSHKLIDGFATVLRRHYPDTSVRRDGEAVRVKMSNDLGFDVVPCFSLEPYNPPEQSFYVIPDGQNGWIRTNPRIDNEVSDFLQKHNNGHFRPAVKLLKWWNEHRFAKRFSSYYIELATMRAFDARNQWTPPVGSLSDAVHLAFQGLYTAAANGDLQSWLREALPVERGPLSLEQLRDLNAAADQAGIAVAYERQGETQNAIQEWKAIFGRKFVTD